MAAKWEQWAHWRPTALVATSIRSHVEYQTAKSKTKRQRRKDYLRNQKLHTPYVSCLCVAPKKLTVHPYVFLPRSPTHFKLAAILPCEQILTTSNCLWGILFYRFVWSLHYPCPTNVVRSHRAMFIWGKRHKQTSLLHSPPHQSISEKGDSLMHDAHSAAPQHVVDSKVHADPERRNLDFIHFQQLA